jgi:hypothetical protein
MYYNIKVLYFTKYDEHVEKRNKIFHRNKLTTMDIFILRINQNMYKIYEKNYLLAFLQTFYYFFILEKLVLQNFYM